MKKSVYVIVISLFLGLLLTACSSGSNPIESNTVTPSGTVNQDDVSNTPSVTPSPSPSPSPSPTPTPTPIPVIEDRMSETDEPGVYSLSTLDLNGYYLNVYRLKNKILYFFNQGVTTAPQIIAYDISTGETVERVFEEIRSVDYKFKVIEDEFIVISKNRKELLFIDENLEDIYSFTIPIDTVYPEFTANSDYSKVYFIKNKNLIECDTKTGEEKSICKNSILADAYPIGITGDGRYLKIFAYTRSAGYYDMHLLNFESGKLTLQDPALYEYKYFISPDGSEILAFSDLPVSAFLCRADEDILEILDMGKEVPNAKVKTTIEILPKEGNIVEKVDWERRSIIIKNIDFKDDTTILNLTCYDIDSGKAFSNYVTEFERIIRPNYCLSTDYEGGYLLFSGTDLKEPFCYAWDYKKDTYEDPSKNYVRTNYIPEYLEEKRKELEEKYKTYIYLGSEIFSGEHAYTLEYCPDSYQMYRSLCMLDEVFSMYPEDFFDQIKFDDVKTTGIYLCNGFIKKASYGIEDAVALAGTDRYERFLALDVSYWGDMRSNIIHELSHWIDNRINQQGKATGEFDFEAEWSKLNPEDYHYMDDYNVTSPFSRYTYPYAGEDAYFIDTYSLTKATEDRARLFENLMRYDPERGTCYFESEAIRAKMHLYFEYIRKSFDTSDWPEETIWEHRLKLLDRMYSGDESVTFETIYPEAFNGDPAYSFTDEDYGYIDAYYGSFDSVG